MTTVLLIVALIVIVWSLAAWAAALWLWTLSLGVWLLLTTVYAGWHFGVSFLWLGWAILALLNRPTVRSKLLIHPLLQLFRRRLPPISRTEREALAAGDVSWEGALFSGQLNWDAFLQHPMTQLTAAEQAFFDGPTEQLCSLLNEWQITHELNDLPPEVWQFLRQHGFFGLIIPQQYGGKGFSATAHSAIVAKIGSRSGTAGITVMVPNSLGPAELLLHYGTTAQKDYYLPRLARGEELPCFALTNPYAGSDASAIPDYGIVCYGEYEGQQVLGMRVTWEKRYITLAPVATVLGLAFHLYDPDHLLGQDSDIGITLALIPTHYPGVTIGRRHFPARQAFQNGPTSGQAVFIPMQMVIGGQAQLGQGWGMLMSCLAAGRAISLPAMSTATVQLCARFSGAYARIRKQFKRPIGEFEGIEEPLSRLAAHAYQLEATRQVTNAILDQGIAPPIISALFKYRATHSMREALNDALDIHGGKAICDGPSNYLFNDHQLMPVAITVEGANILTRSLIVFGQGALRCHPYLLAEWQAAQLPDTEAVPAFDRALGGHLRFSLSTGARALFHNLSGGYWLATPRSASPPVRHWYRHLSRASLNFALVSDVLLLLLGGHIKTREKLSGRLADCLSNLYFLSCTLKRYHHDGNPAADHVLVDWILANGLYDMQQHFIHILANIPNRWLAVILRRWLFPFGLPYQPPHDAQGKQVARLLLTPSATRDRISPLVYNSPNPKDVTGCLEHALQLTLTLEPVLARLHDAMKAGVFITSPWQTEAAVYQQAYAQGLLNAQERDQLLALIQAVRRVIMVDDFAPEALSRCGSMCWMDWTQVA